MHHVAVAVPAFSPFHPETVVRAVEVRPETEIERRDEEDPVERRACARVGRVVRFWRAEVERVGVPCPRGIAVFDETVSYLCWREVSERTAACQRGPNAYILRRGSHSIVVDLNKVDGLGVLMKKLCL